MKVFLLMPPILRNGSFLFVLQNQPFYHDGEAAYLSRAVHRRSPKWWLVYEEWMDKDG